MTRYTAIGLEEGKKRTLVWLEGELIGDDDVKERFQRAWDAIDKEAFQESLPLRDRDYWKDQLVEQILRDFFEETLDVERGRVSTDEELQERANIWNTNPEGRHYTVEKLREMEERENWSHHHGPPYFWSEIEAAIEQKPSSRSSQPSGHPKCLECLAPMEWIYFKSSKKTWEMLCGRAGWTAICRQCKTWRACRVDVMN